MITFREFVNNQIQTAKGNMPDFVAGTANGSLDPETKYGHVMRNPIPQDITDPTKTAKDLMSQEKTLQQRTLAYKKRQNEKRAAELDYFDQLAKQQRIEQSKAAITIP